jgi:hypothetical protein
MRAGPELRTFERSTYEDTGTFMYHHEYALVIP